MSTEATPLNGGPSTTRWTHARILVVAAVALLSIFLVALLLVGAGHGPGVVGNGLCRDAAGLGQSAQQRPFWYLHIPKASTSFMCEVVYGVCPSVPRVDKNVCKYREEGCLLGSPQFQTTCAPRFSHMEMGHASPQPSDYASGSAFVGMFREPSTRMASGFAHAFHDCPAMTSKYGCDEHAVVICPAVMQVTVEKVKEYFDCVKGCQTRMTVGESCGHRKNVENVEPSADQIKEAIRHIRQNFVYVGITEQFEDSVKDFSKLMGRTVPPPMEAFGNSNPGRDGAKQAEAEVIAILRANNLVDHADEQVYAVAKQKHDNIHVKCAA